MVGDDTREWGPPFVDKRDGSKESVYFLSVNRNKKVGQISTEILVKLLCFLICWNGTI